MEQTVPQAATGLLDWFRVHAGVTQWLCAAAMILTMGPILWISFRLLAQASVGKQAALFALCVAVVAGLSAAMASLEHEAPALRGSTAATPQGPRRPAVPPDRTTPPDPPAPPDGWEVVRAWNFDDRSNGLLQPIRGTAWHFEPTAPTEDRGYALVITGDAMVTLPDSIRADESRADAYYGEWRLAFDIRCEEQTPPKFLYLSTDVSIGMREVPEPPGRKPIGFAVSLPDGAVEIQEPITSTGCDAKPVHGTKTYGPTPSLDDWNRIAVSLRDGKLTYEAGWPIPQVIFSTDIPIEVLATTWRSRVIGLSFYDCRVDRMSLETKGIFLPVPPRPSAATRNVPDREKLP